jgi:hypothetical protein
LNSHSATISKIYEFNLEIDLKSEFRKLWKKFTYDNKGERVLWQTPNPPIIGWAIFRIAASLTSDVSAKNNLSLIGNAFLFTWAYLEIAQGASYFRRLLGAIVMIALIANYLSS